MGRQAAIGDRTLMFLISAGRGGVNSAGDSHLNGSKSRDALNKRQILVGTGLKGGQRQPVGMKLTDNVAT